jgi:hypothetical protein
MSLFWNWSQQRRIYQAETQAASARARARTAETRADAVQAEIDRLLLANAAMWSILKDRLGVGDEELGERMRDLDATDGKLDGKLRVKPTLCPACFRRSPKTAKACLYCGQATPRRSPFAAD